MIFVVIIDVSIIFQLGKLVVQEIQKDFDVCLTIILIKTYIKKVRIGL